jgi:hypothetical protein
VGLAGLVRRRRRLRAVLGLTSEVGAFAERRRAHGRVRRRLRHHARVGEAQAVYARARATQVPDGDGIEVFSRASVEAGIGPWTVANVTAPAELRLYRADVTELSLLDPQATGGRDIRVPVGLTTP